MEQENFDLKCYNFNTNLINLINESNLPASVVYFILKDVLITVECEKNRVLNDVVSRIQKNGTVEGPITIEEEDNSNV